MATKPALNPNEISRLQLLEIALQAERERIELAENMDNLESRLETIEQQTPNGRQGATIATGKRLYTVQQTVDAYPAFSMGGLRHLIFFSTGKNPNGFSACMRRVGRRILIDADSFEAWIEQRQ